MNLTPEQKGYIAGMMDGEGCLYYNPRPKNRGYHPVMNIANTNEEVIVYLQSLIGGTVHRRETPDNWKDSFCLMAHSGVLRELLPQIEDLLIVKRAQAKLMLRWLELFGRFGPKKEFAGHGIEIQSLFWKYNKQLNQRGIGKSDEFRGSLSNETILSQALQEIEEKVQRLEDEAKGIEVGKISKLVKENGLMTKSEIIRKSSSAVRGRVNELLNCAHIESVKIQLNHANKPVTIYAHVNNSSTSVRPERDDIV